MKRYVTICLLDFLQIMALFMVGLVIALFHIYINGFDFISFLGDLLGVMFFGLPTLIMTIFILWVLNVLFMIPKIKNNIFLIINIQILFLVFSILAIALIEIGDRIEFNIYGLAIISAIFILFTSIALILKIKSKIILKYNLN